MHDVEFQSVDSGKYLDSASTVVDAAQHKERTTTGFDESDSSRLVSFVADRVRENDELGGGKDEPMNGQRGADNSVFGFLKNLFAADSSTSPSPSDCTAGTVEVFDVLSEHDLGVGILTETGFLPVEYDDLFRKFFALPGTPEGMKATLDIEEDGRDFVYTLGAFLDDAGWSAQYSSSRDYFHIEMVVHLLNQVLSDAAIDQRFVDLPTMDQTSFVICVDAGQVEDFQEWFETTIIPNDQRALR